MIPRTQANYCWSDLRRAWGLSEDSRHYRELLIGALSDRFPNRHVLLMPSGRGALYHLLRAYEQSKVLIPAYTCKAVVEAARLAGKQLVFADTDADDFNMSCAEAEQQIDRNTIVMATHQFGFPCDIRRLQTCCRERGAVLMEDCAAALGTQIDREWAGTFGDAAFFSFDTTKLVTVPLKAGFVLIRDADVYQRVQQQRDADTSPVTWRDKSSWLAQATALCGLENRWAYRGFHAVWFSARGRFTDDRQQLNNRLGPFYTRRMAEWQAAIALPQIRRLPEIVDRRRELHRAYHEQLTGCRHIQLPPRDAEHSWSCIRFPIRVDDKLGFYRAACRAGVDFAFSFTFLGCSRDYRRAWSLADRVLDLPFYFKLSPADCDRVSSVLRALDRKGPPWR